MGCVQSYFKRAHNAGISPSSTQESNSKQAASEDGTKPIQEDRSITEEPESNDTSYGVEATAVRTLAASTGTVAILGTTAKTGDKKDGDKEGSDTASPGVVNTIHEEQEEPTVNVEKAVVHVEDKGEEDTKESENSSRPDSTSRRPASSQLEGSAEKKEDIVAEEKLTSPVSVSSETKEENLPSESPVVSNKSPLTESNKSEFGSPEVKSPVLPSEETEPKNAEENASEPVVSELTKEDDMSKSISSERLKTNSISNTTLSSDSIAEFENNSIKQSPSADKVIESFDSSSTVEFVDTTTKELTRDDNRTNPARSISSDLSNKVSLPPDSEKTPDILSPEEPEDKLSSNDPSSPPAVETETALEATALDEVKQTPTKLEESLVKVPSEPEQIELNPNSSSKDLVASEDTSVNSEISSNMSSSIQSVVKNENSPQEINSKSAIDNSSPNASDENNKAETGSPFSSDNNSSFNDNGDATSPVTAVVESPAPASNDVLADNHVEETKLKNTNSIEIKAKHDDTETTLEKTESVEMEAKKNETETEIESTETVEATLEANKEETKLETTKSVESIIENHKVETTESDASDKVQTTAELINGLSSRTVTPNEKPLETPPNVEIVSKTNSVEVRNSLESVDNKTPELKVNGEVADDGFGSPIDLTDEKVVAAATAIQASFRGFQTRQNLKASERGEGAQENPKFDDADSEVKKSTAGLEETPLNSVSEGFDSTTEQPDSILEDVDDKMIAAATTIQANFRGFQTRQMMKSKLDSGLPASEETNPSSERKTPTALTPELIESVKEEVNDICKEAETIAAERSESAEGMVKGVEQVVVEAKQAGLPSVSESMKAVRGSVSPPSVTEDEDIKEEVFDPLVDADEQTIHAATKIQASFRGFQTRKTLQQTNQDQPDSMPDFPPPAAEDEYLQSLEDLPPPDFEALESSYSEDVPTEPLAPPPDSIIFNEEDEDELMSLQRPPECDELPEHRLTLDTDSSESSLSSAATKIQAGVRGYLTRKQIQVQGGGTGTSTSTTVPDSDQSLSVSREDDGVRSAISTEEESEICRHRASPDSETLVTRPSRSATKRMSLGSNVVEQPQVRNRAPLRSALSVQSPGPNVDDEEIWSTLKNEMADAATTIQSNFRGYRARKQLQREDAVQVTSSSSQATPSSGSVDTAGRASAEGGEDKTGRASAESGKNQTARSSTEGGEEKTSRASTGGGEDKTGRASAESGKNETARSSTEGGEEKTGRASTGSGEDKTGRASTEGGEEKTGRASKEGGEEKTSSASTGGGVDKTASSSTDGGESKTARSSGEYHDIIALTPPNVQPTEGGGAPARSAAVAGQPADEMVKRRAEDDAKEAAAATKIQATYRGFKSRKEMRDVDQAAAKIQAGFRGYKVRKEMKKNDIMRSSSTPEKGSSPQHGSAEETAATKIQAGVRGFLVRRQYQKEQDAATKIQAGFRGFRSRKQVADQ